MANPGMVSCERVIRFRPKARNWDELQWEDLKVSSRVREAKGTALDYAIYIEEISSITDDSDGLIKIVAKEILGEKQSLIQLTLNVDANHIKKLQDPAVHKLKLSAVIDPSKIVTAALGPAAIPIPGVSPVIGASLGRLLRREVKGQVQIGIEFPHPIIWYPFAEGDVGEGQFYLLDSNDPQGTFCPLELRRFNPDTAKFDRHVPEKLTVKLTGNPDQMLDDGFLSEHIREKGFFLRTKRVVVGKDQATGSDRREGGSIQPSRGPGKTPAAQNQGVELPVWYKIYPATLSIEVHADPGEKRKWTREGKQETKWICGAMQLQGETVEVLCPNLPRDFQGSLHWKITDGPSRMSEAGSGFVSKGVEQQSPLTDLTRDGQTCRGAVIQIVPDPLTEAAPVMLDVPAPTEEKEWELVVKFDPESEREYQGIKLGKNEFVADGKDKLRVVVYARRKGCEPEELGELDHVDLGLDGMQYGDAWICRLASQEPTMWTWEVFAEDPLLYTAQRKALSPSLHVTATVRSGGKLVELQAPQQDLRLRLLHLKLWVMPGRKPGTAQAAAICCLAPERGRVLSGVPLRLRIVNLGGGSKGGLALIDADTQLTSKDGTARWELKYRRGCITWENVKDAKWRVSCGVENARRKVREATSFTIDVRRNMLDLLKALDAAAPSLNLTNPFFQSRGWLAWAGDWAFPDALRGAVWNALCAARGRFDADPYVCQQSAGRIFVWLRSRRIGKEGLQDPGFDAERMASMNGIEIAQYTISPAHTFAGIHFSGTGPDEDPRLFDPWWRQEWGDVLTWREQMLRLLAALGTIPLVCVAVIVAAKLAVALVISYAAASAGFFAWILGTTPVVSAGAVTAWLKGTAVLKAGLSAGGMVAASGQTITLLGYKFWFGADTAFYLDAEGAYQGTSGDWVKMLGKQWTTQPEELPCVSPHETSLEG